MQFERFETFSAQISSIYRNIQKIKNKYSKEIDIKPVHIFWIYLLSNYPDGLSASDLARKSKSNRSLISREINELLEKGYIRPSENKQRKYGEKLILTEEGKQLAKIIRRVSNDVQNEVSQGISLEELKIFYNVLAELSKKFESITESNNIQKIIAETIKN